MLVELYPRYCLTSANLLRIFVALQLSIMSGMTRRLIYHSNAAESAAQPL
jgi:hypothetical protein